MKWLACLFTVLALSPGVAWAQADEDVELDPSLIEQVRQSNLALAKSKERLEQTLQGYRDELDRLRSDRDEFRRELKMLTEFVNQKQVQVAEVRRQMSDLYKKNIEYSQQAARLQWEQAKRVALPEKTEVPDP